MLVVFGPFFFGFQALQRPIFCVPAGSLPINKKRPLKRLETNPIGWIFSNPIGYFSEGLRGISSHPTRWGGIPGSEPWRMRKVRTGEDLWRQSDQSTLWGLTDFDRFFGSGEIIFSGTQIKQITDPKYLHIHHGVLLKKGVFWMIFCECSKWARKCIGAIWYKFCGVVFLVVLVESQQGEKLRIELDWNMMHDGVQIDIQCRSGSILHIV